jgi:DNA-binding MarR family transcriptional regulator
MVKNLAKRAMTTEGQRACFVIDHLVEALGNQSSSSTRRALILVDIDQYPGSTQTAIMERLNINKSAINREIDWLFNYGCIMRQESKTDARAIKLETCGYSKKAISGALDYFDGDHEKLKNFIALYEKALGLEKPALRDAKILATLYDRKAATKQVVLDSLYSGSASTENRAFNKLIDEGVIKGETNAS